MQELFTGQVTTPDAGVDLYWLPLGAGDNTHCVRVNGRVFEAAAARHQHRASCDLYHAALAVGLDGQRFTIEMAPVWGTDAPDRGVVCEGPGGCAGWVAHASSATRSDCGAVG